MRRRTVRAAVLAAVAAAVLGCAQQPDRTLHPSPPAVAYRPLTHPFQGATLAVDPDSEAARWQRAHEAGWLAPIAEQPQARWVNSPQDIDTLVDYLHSLK